MRKSRCDLGNAIIILLVNGQVNTIRNNVPCGCRRRCRTGRVIAGGLESIVLKWVTWGRQSRIEQRMCERRGACEPAVEDEEAGAIAEDERGEDCLINYL